MDIQNECEVPWSPSYNPYCPPRRVIAIQVRWLKERPRGSFYVLTMDVKC